MQNSIAEKIFSKYAKITPLKLAVLDADQIDYFVKQVEKQNPEIEQDFNNETTTYTFQDGTKLIWSGETIEIGEYENDL